MRVQPHYAAPRAYHHNVRKQGIARLFRNVVLSICGLIVLFYLLAVGELIALRWIAPPTTTVQVQRRLEAWIGRRPYHKRYQFVPLAAISPQLQHAVISAEDGRFYEHHGVDWKQVQQVIDQDLDTGRLKRLSDTFWGEIHEPTRHRVADRPSGRSRHGGNPSWRVDRGPRPSREHSRSRFTGRDA